MIKVYHLRVIQFLGIIAIVCVSLAFGIIIRQLYWESFTPKPYDYPFMIEGPRTTYYCSRFDANNGMTRIFGDCITHRNLIVNHVTLWNNGHIYAEPAQRLMKGLYSD